MQFRPWPLQNKELSGDQESGCQPPRYIRRTFTRLAPLAGSLQCSHSRAQNRLCRCAAAHEEIAADDLKLSFVPDAAQREWRALARTRVEYGRDVIRWRNRMEGILEEGGIKISSFLSDLLGVSGRRMLRALIVADQNAQQLAALGVGRLRASREELAEAPEGDLRPSQRLLLEQHLDQIEALERQMGEIDRALDQALAAHHDAIARICEIPGIAATSAQQIVAEIGVQAASFPSSPQLASWVGVCPGREESAGVSRSDASAKGNRSMRRILNQCAWGAVRTKGSQFESLFRRWVPSARH